MKEKNSSVKTLIKEALINLMNEKSYINISVTDITNKAGVARASFYRNYQSVADIMDEIADDIFSEIVDALPIIKSTDKRNWREFLFYMFYNFPKHHSVSGGKKPENINELFSRMDMRLQNMKKESEFNSLKEKYLVFGKMGLIVNIIKRWMSSGMEESPEEMVDFIMSFILLF